MDEKYRLVFRGEVLDGQHRAVVKRRLSESLALKDGQLEKLFSGGSVVLKRGADAKLAARYQALFKKAGARLRVFAEAAAEAPESPAPVANGEPPAAPAAEAPSAETVAPLEPQAPPPGATFTLLDPAELDKLVAREAGRAVEISAPDFALAELGAQLGTPRVVELLELPDIELTLAEPGVDLLEDRPEVEPVVVVEASFELAEVGADLGPDTERTAPPAPDTSHLAVVEEA